LGDIDKNAVLNMETQIKLLKNVWFFTSYKQWKFKMI
jgi:hypothetical protein